MKLRDMFLSGLTVLLAFTVFGCGASTDQPAADGAAAATATSAADQHDGWWCQEHGIPEGVCAQCDAKVAAERKAKGDWCSQHDRPDSQCFVCHPDLSKEFAALYEARYGKAPPPRGDEQMN